MAKAKKEKKGFLFGFIGTLVKLVFPYRIVFKCEVPKAGAMIACANHISYIDPFFVRESIGRKVVFMAKKEIFRSKIIAFFAKQNGVIPVDRNANDYNAVKRALGVIKSDTVLGIFPEGTRAFKNPNRERHDGAALFAIKTGIPILPIFIDTKNGRVRPFRRSTVYVGEPLYISPDTERKTGTEMIMSAIKAAGEIS